MPSGLKRTKVSKEKRSRGSSKKRLPGKVKHHELRRVKSWNYHDDRPLGTLAPRIRKCALCKKKFTPIYGDEPLCQKCMAQLPQCFTCGAKVIPGYSNYESSLTKVGEYELCGSCYMALKNNGFLRGSFTGPPMLSQNHFLLPDGSIVVIPTHQANDFFDERHKGKCKSLAKFLRRRKRYERQSL